MLSISHLDTCHRRRSSVLTPSRVIHPDLCPLYLHHRRVSCNDPRAGWRGQERSVAAATSQNTWGQNCLAVRDISTQARWSFKRRINWIPNCTAIHPSWSPVIGHYSDYFQLGEFNKRDTYKNYSTALSVSPLPLSLYKLCLESVEWRPVQYYLFTYLNGSVWQGTQSMPVRSAASNNNNELR